MKKLFFAILSAAAIVLNSCTDLKLAPGNPDAIQNRPGTVIRAYSEGATKTVLSPTGEEDTYDVLWSEGDVITLILSDSRSESRHVFTLVDGAGTTSAEFSCPDVIDWSAYSSIRAYYGYDGTSWPSAQKSAGGEAVTNVPMYAVIDSFSGSEAPSLAFKNIGGILQVNLKGYSIVKKIIVESTNRISGAIGGYSSDAATLNTLATKETSISLSLTNGVKLDKTVAKSFHIAVPQKTAGYEGIRITVVDDLGNEFSKSLNEDKTLVISRGIITPANLPAIQIDGTCKNGTLGLFAGSEAVIFKPLNGIGEEYINLAVETSNQNDGRNRDNVCLFNGGCSYYYNVMNNSYNTFATRTGSSSKQIWGLPSAMEVTNLVNYLYSEGSWDGTRKGLAITFGDHEFFLPACGKANGSTVTDNAYAGYYWTNEISDPFNHPKDVTYITFNETEPYAHSAQAAPSTSCALSVRLVYSL